MDLRLDYRVVVASISDLPNRMILSIKRNNNWKMDSDLLLNSYEISIYSRHAIVIPPNSSSSKTG